MFSVLPIASKINQNLLSTTLYSHLSICYSLLVFKIHLNKNLLEEHFMPEELVSFLPGVFILCLFIPLVFFFSIYQNIQLILYWELHGRRNCTLHLWFWNPIIYHSDEHSSVDWIKKLLYMHYTEVFQITVVFFRRDIMLYKFSKLKG